MSKKNHPIQGIFDHDSGRRNDDKKFSIHTLITYYSLVVLKFSEQFKKEAASDMVKGRSNIPSYKRGRPEDTMTYAG